MTLASVTARGRRAAEALMSATVRVEYATGRTAQDEDTGKEAPVSATRFESVARFQMAGRLTDTDTHVGGRREVLDRVQVHLPVSAPQVHTDDRIVCLTNPTDPRLVGRVFMVGAPMNKTDSTATRLNVEEAS